MTDCGQFIWVAWSNTDLTEGRGASVPIAVCECEATAIRLGKGHSVQGSNCPVTKHESKMHCGQLYGPVCVISPSVEDRKEQERLDKRVAAIEKARKAGLSEEEIAALSK